jgi:glycosyltransferase involved in cell wall biosynthesis
MPDRPLKILYVSTMDDPKNGAGAERTMNLLMQSVKARGHDLAIAATSEHRGLERDDRDGVRIWRAGLKNIYWPKRELKTIAWPLRRIWHLLDAYNWAMRKQLRQIIELERPDVISAHQLAGWSASALDAAADAGVPVVQVLHDYYNACANSMLFKNGEDCVQQCTACKTLRYATHAISNRAAAVVGVSQYVLQRHLALQFYNDGPRRHVIHNARSRDGLKLQEAARLRAQRPGPGGGPIIFGFIGTIAPHKGIELLLETFRELPSGQAELIVAGSGRADYVAGLKQRFASPALHFMGQVEPYQFFAQADVTIVPSLWQEPLGMIVPESFAFGVPVAAAKRGGIAEMIDEGENGLLFDPDLSGDLLRAMMFFVDRKSNLGRFCQNASQRGAEFLDTAAWALKYEAIYTQAAAGAA